MTSKTLGQIFRLIQQSFMPTSTCFLNDEERKQRTAMIQMEADLAKHDICAYIDAQAEMACDMIDGKHKVRAHFKYPENDLSGLKIIKTARNEWKIVKDQ
jgi:hypothetical protein